MSKKIMTIIAVFSLLSGCASITRGTKDNFSIESEPSGAIATISTGISCTTPCAMEMPRKYSFTVTVGKEGYTPVTADVIPQQAGKGTAGMAGNLIFGGLIGAAVDAGSGAMKDLYPNPLVIKLETVESGRPSTVVLPVMVEKKDEEADMAKSEEK